MTNSQIVSELQNLADSIGTATHKYGPVAISTTAEWIHVYALIKLGMGVLAFVLGITVVTWSCSPVFLAGARAAYLKHYESRTKDDFPWEGVIRGLIFVVFSFVIVFASSVLFDPANWIAAMNGRLGLLQLVLYNVGINP